MKMKKLLVLFAIASALPFMATAYQTTEETEFLTDILKIEQDHSFPVETIQLTYLKHCTEVFSNVWLQDVEPGHTNIGVSVKRVAENCLMDQPVWSNETVTIKVNSDVPTEYGLLRNLSLAVPFFSGISVDNFN